MANTTNLNLAKPAGTDKALVSVLNSNSDKIDAWAGATNQALSNRFKEISSGSVKDITTSGVYYLTTGVSDLPFAGQAYLCVMSVQNVNRIAGIFVGVTNGITYSLKAINRGYQYFELAPKSDLNTPVYINQTNGEITSNYTIRNCRICQVGCIVQLNAIVNNGDAVFPSGRFTLLKVGNAKLLPATTNLSFVAAGGTAINGIVNRYAVALMNASNGEIYIDNIVTSDVKEIAINITYICLNN